MMNSYLYEYFFFWSYVEWGLKSPMHLDHWVEYIGKCFMFPSIINQYFWDCELSSIRFYGPVN